MFRTLAAVFVLTLCLIISSNAQLSGSNDRANVVVSPTIDSALMNSNQNGLSNALNSDTSVQQMQQMLQQQQNTRNNALVNSNNPLASGAGFGSSASFSGGASNMASGFSNNAGFNGNFASSNGFSGNNAMFNGGFGQGFNGQSNNFMSSNGMTSNNQFNNGFAGNSQFNGGLSSSSQFNGGLSGSSQFNGGVSGSSQFNSGLSGGSQFNGGLSSGSQFNGGLSGGSQFNGGLSGSSQFNGGLSGSSQFNGFNSLSNQPMLSGALSANPFNPIANSLLNHAMFSPQQLLSNPILRMMGPNGLYDPEYLYDQCSGDMCLEPSTGHRYYSCDLIYYGFQDGSQCGPNSVKIQDCIGVTCMDDTDGTTHSSCDLMKFNYDGNTCAPGTTQVASRLRSQPYSSTNDCEGITCVHVLTGIDHTYNSCNLVGYGYNGKTCAPGFRAQGSCGPHAYNAMCALGECCSDFGFCGTGSGYCNSNALFNYTDTNTLNNPFMNLYNPFAVNPFNMMDADPLNTGAFQSTQTDSFWNQFGGNQFFNSFMQSATLNQMLGMMNGGSMNAGSTSNNAFMNNGMNSFTGNQMSGNSFGSNNAMAFNGMNQVNGNSGSTSTWNGMNMNGASANSFGNSGAFSGANSGMFTNGVNNQFNNNLNVNNHIG